MKNLITILIFTGLGIAIIYSFCKGMELEQRRQCIVAIDNCDKYSDAGACKQKYLKVCENVKI